MGVSTELKWLDGRPPTLVCEPGHYHRSGVFDVWSLPDRHSARAEQLEKKLDEILDHYLEEVERCRWYGF